MMTQNIGENSPMEEPYDIIDKFNFQDVIQFSDQQETNNNISDPNIYFLKFPVLNDSLHEHEHEHGHGHGHGQEHDLLFDSTSTGGEHDQVIKCPQDQVVKNKKKRTRSIKTSEEVESQRMTHIAVERNRRKQMNEHLRVLRSLMPGSYVQRGDQASIIGGAIEFVRELEQLLQCLESQKRRRLYGGDATNPTTLVGVDQEPTHHQPLFLPHPNDELENGSAAGGGGGGCEESAESKSCIADVEVKLLGFEAMIKILSRRRVGQLVKTIAALEDLQLNILHINITTIDQTVLYSLTVKVGGEARLTAEEIANSVQQIFTFIHAYNNI